MDYSKVAHGCFTEYKEYKDREYDYRRAGVATVLAFSLLVGTYQMHKYYNTSSEPSSEWVRQKNSKELEGE